MNVFFFIHMLQKFTQFMIFCLLSLNLILNETEYSKCCTEQEKIYFLLSAGSGPSKSKLTTKPHFQTVILDDHSIDLVLGQCY